MPDLGKLIEQMQIALLSALLTLSIIVPGAYAMYASRPPQIASVDLAQLLKEEEQRFSAKASANMSEQERRALVSSVEQYGKRLSDQVDALSQSCDCVLINKAAILGQTKVLDLTPALRERVKP